MTSNVQIAVYMLVGLIIGVIFHEFMHGAVAYLMGDTTAKRAGRLTLDPLAHVDPFGTLLLPGIMFLLSLLGTGFPFIIGYAKPVPINPFQFRKRRGIIYVSLAGVAANLAIAFLALGVAKLLFETTNQDQIVITFLYIAYINVVLLVFNLIPIPPLDGSRVVAYFLRGEALGFYQSLEPYGFFIILAIVMLFGFILATPVSAVFNLLARLVALPFRI